MPVVILPTGPVKVLEGAIMQSVSVPTTIAPGTFNSASTTPAQPVTSPVQVMGLVPVFPCCVPGAPPCVYQNIIQVQVQKGTGVFVISIPDGGTTYSFTLLPTNTAAQAQAIVNAVLPTGYTCTVTRSATGEIFTITLNTLAANAGVLIGLGTGPSNDGGVVIKGSRSTFACLNNGCANVGGQGSFTINFASCGPNFEFSVKQVFMGTPQTSNPIVIPGPTSTSGVTLASMAAAVQAVMPAGFVVSPNLVSGSLAANTAVVQFILIAPANEGVQWNGVEFLVVPVACVKVYSSVPMTGGISCVHPTDGPQNLPTAPATDCSCDCRYGKHRADILADDRNFPLTVFASSSCSDDYHNDYNSFLFKYAGTYDPLTSVDFHLQKQVNGVFTNVAALNTSAYGTPIYNYCASSNTGLGGYQLSWNLILTAFGEGSYSFTVTGTAPGGGTYCFFSPPFCLKTWDCYAVDGTVKFEASYSGGTFGSVSSQGASWSLCCAGATPAAPSTAFAYSDSIRIPALFGYRTAEFQRDFIKYATGVINKIRDEAVESYLMKTNLLPMWFHERFYAYALMADQLYVSDYNINNADYNLKGFFVVADGNYTPVYTNSSRYMKVQDMKFKKGDQFVYRDRCCG